MSRGEKLYYVLSLLCIITGVLGAVTCAVYVIRGGSQFYSDEQLKVSTMAISTVSYLIFRAVPGFLGYRGFKKHNPQFVMFSMVLIAIAIVMTLAVQPRLPGVGTGWLLPVIYLIISFRYYRALTAEQREKDSRFIQKGEDGPRLQK